jgi:hypothetical protein
MSMMNTEWDEWEGKSGIRHMLIKIFLFIFTLFYQFFGAFLFIKKQGSPTQFFVSNRVPVPGFWSKLETN